MAKPSDFHDSDDSDMEDYNARLNRLRNYEHKEKQACAGSCGGYYNQSTFDRYDGLHCGRCHPVWMSRNKEDHYSEKNALKIPFYEKSKSTLDNSLKGDEELEGKGYSDYQMNLTRNVLRGIAKERSFGSKSNSKSKSRFKKGYESSDDEYVQSEGDEEEGDEEEGDDAEGDDEGDDKDNKEDEKHKKSDDVDEGDEGEEEEGDDEEEGKGGEKESDQDDDDDNDVKINTKGIRVLPAQASHRPDRDGSLDHSNDELKNNTLDELDEKHVFPSSDPFSISSTDMPTTRTFKKKRHRCRDCKSMNIEDVSDTEEEEEEQEEKEKNKFDQHNSESDKENEDGEDGEKDAPIATRLRHRKKRRIFVDSDQDDD